MAKPKTRASKRKAFRAEAQREQRAAERIYRPWTEATTEHVSRLEKRIGSYAEPLARIEGIADRVGAVERRLDAYESQLARVGVDGRVVGLLVALEIAEREGAGRAHVRQILAALDELRRSPH